MKTGPLYLWFVLFSLGHLSAETVDGHRAPGTPINKEGTSSFLPKEEIGALSHLQANPTEDGRGVVVAVIDTGIDLGHPGLEKTSHGLPKIIDYYDATDSDFVDVKTAATLNDDHTILGLSGRTLSLPPDLSEDLRLGLIAVNKHFPRLVRHHFKKDQHRQKLIETGQEDVVAAEAGYQTQSHQNLTVPEVMDIVGFEIKGEKAVLIDTDQDGDLRDETILRTYRDHFDTAKIGGPIGLVFAVNLFENGQSVNLLYDGDSHGTHVAGIVSAYHGDNHPLNGVAPGAQIIAIRCGDPKTKRDSASYGSIIRGIHYAIQNGADVINVSYGGMSHRVFPAPTNHQSLNEILRLSDTACFISIGNHGPALSTHGTPGCNRTAFGIAASISPATMASNYGTTHDNQDRMWGFSSRGPTYNGDPGVDFAAPGSAVSATPLFTGNHSENKHGTSMSCPQAAGAAALMISTIKNRQWPYSLARLERAMIQGCQTVPGTNRIDVGHGMIHVPASLEAYQSQLDLPCNGWDVQITNNKMGPGGSGLYNRECDFDYLKDYTLLIKPDLPSNTSQEEKALYHCTLQFKSDQDWLRIQSAPAAINAEGLRTKIEVDPQGLKPGLNIGTIKAFRLTETEAGPLLSDVVEFVIPAVLIKPEEVPANKPLLSKAVPFQSGDTKRIFVKAPLGSSHAIVSLKETQLQQPLYKVAARSVNNTSVGNSHSHSQVIRFKNDVPQKFAVPVLPGQSMELCIQRSFLDPLESHLDVEIEFIGLQLYTYNPIPGSREALCTLSYTMGSPALEFKASSSKQAGFAVPAKLDVAIHPIQGELYNHTFLYQHTIKYSTALSPGKWTTRVPTLYYEQGGVIGYGIKAYDQSGRLLLDLPQGSAELAIKTPTQVSVEVTWLSFDKAFYKKFKPYGMFEKHKKSTPQLVIEPGPEQRQGKPLKTLTMRAGLSRSFACRFPEDTAMNGQVADIHIKLKDSDMTLIKRSVRFPFQSPPQPSLKDHQKTIQLQASKSLHEQWLQEEQNLNLAANILKPMAKKNPKIALSLFEHQLRPGQKPDLGKLEKQLQEKKAALDGLKKKERPLLSRLLVCEARLCLLASDDQSHTLKAAELLNQAQELTDKESPIALHTAWQISQRQGNARKEEQTLNKLLKLHPHNWTFVSALADLESRMGKTDQARLRLLKAWIADPRLSKKLQQAMAAWHHTKNYKETIVRDFHLLLAKQETKAPQWHESMSPFFTQVTTYDQAVRQKALDALHSYDSPSAVFGRRAFLKDKNMNLRLSAALSGALLGDKLCLQTLRKDFLKFKAPEHKMKKVLDLIASDNTDEVRRFLVSLLEKDPWQTQAHQHLVSLTGEDQGHKAQNWQDTLKGLHTD